MLSKFPGTLRLLNIIYKYQVELSQLGGIFFYFNFLEITLYKWYTLEAMFL